MHIKRKTISNLWPVARTGTKYMAVPTHDNGTAVPLIVVMINILKIVKNKKELKKLLQDKKIMVNHKVAQEINYPVSLFDSITLHDANKNYRAILINKRISLKETTEAESKKRIYKIIGKKILGKDKVQVNLSNGRNILSKEDIKTGSFAVVDMTSNKIIKVMTLGKDSSVIVIGGKHTGKSGKIKELVVEGDNTIALIKTSLGEIKANIKNLYLEE
jgi:small subunit ribosomal protein S4e